MKRLIDENMMKVDLRDYRITTKCVGKTRKNEHVSTQVLEKVCNVLHCEIQDIMEFVPDEEREEKVIWLRRKQLKRLNLDSILFNCGITYVRHVTQISFFEKRDMMLTLVFLRLLEKSMKTELKG